MLCISVHGRRSRGGVTCVNLKTFCLRPQARRKTSQLFYFKKVLEHLLFFYCPLVTQFWDYYLPLGKFEADNDTLFCCKLTQCTTFFTSTITSSACKKNHIVPQVNTRKWCFSSAHIAVLEQGNVVVNYVRGAMIKMEGITKAEDYFPLCRGINLPRILDWFPKLHSCLKSCRVNPWWMWEYAYCILPLPFPVN